MLDVKNIYDDIYTVLKTLFYIINHSLSYCPHIYSFCHIYDDMWCKITNNIVLERIWLTPFEIHLKKINSIDTLSFITKMPLRRQVSNYKANSHLKRDQLSSHQSDPTIDASVFIFNIYILFKFLFIYLLIIIMKFLLSLSPKKKNCCSNVLGHTMALSMATTWERSEFRYSFWESPCAWLAVMVKRSKRKMLYLFTKLPLVMVHSWPRCDPERNDLWVWGFELRERERGVSTCGRFARASLCPWKMPKISTWPPAKTSTLSWATYINVLQFKWKNFGIIF